MQSMSPAAQAVAQRDTVQASKVHPVEQGRLVRRLLAPQGDLVACRQDLAPDVVVLVPVGIAERVDVAVDQGFEVALCSRDLADALTGR